MLGTKLKNSRKASVILAVLVLMVCTAGMLLSYTNFYSQTQNSLKDEEQQINEEILEAIAQDMLKGNYILYNDVYEETDRAQVLREYGISTFEYLRNYLEYEVFSWDGKPLLGEDESLQAALAKKANTTYAFRVAFTYQEDGELADVEVYGTRLDEEEQYRIEQYLIQQELNGYDEEREISTPSEVQIVYGMTENALKAYQSVDQSTGEHAAYILYQSSSFTSMLWLFAAVAAGAALFLSLKKGFTFGKERIFHAPLEIVLFCMMLLAIVVDSMAMAEVVCNTIGLGENNWFYMNELGSFLLNFGMWIAFFAVIFWGVVNLSAIVTMKKQYWTERTLSARALRWLRERRRGSRIKQGVGSLLHRMKEFLRRQYDALLHLDFRDKTNRTILKIVALNFVILVIISCMWFYGIAALMIYSILLFLFLRKYFNDIQEKYGLLLGATNRLAEGNLDTPIEGDMGIFNPIQEELKRIQSGFQKAVKEEVKSERMKTELVTNVSHDLKTPLTAIITYIDLLKNETDEEKRKEYTEVLERKSLRLKVLIEDLFEISKAASKNVVMNFMNVDIVDLLKQVGLENDRKIKETNLEFRWNLPKEKIVLSLDSQKTYRIFENLIVNITKYAMPHTRVYIEMQEEAGQVRITMKNVSATELNFDTEEITDRFVRGDSSRNTEGSGLGLAIAKSFTELQHGTLKVETEADLFKVEIVFPKGA